MSNGRTATINPDTVGMSSDDWERLDALTDEEITAAALTDPDALPIPPERLARMGRPLAKVVRYALHLSRAEFAVAYGIPLAKLTAWERQEAQPTETETAYLRLIEREPERAKLVPAE